MDVRAMEHGTHRLASPPSGFEPVAVENISQTLTAPLADLFALYVKTKNFHWHVSGPHFDNAQLALRLRRAHSLCDEYGDVASASLIENWIDEAEHRVWFLS